MLWNHKIYPVICENIFCPNKVGQMWIFIKKMEIFYEVNIMHVDGLVLIGAGASKETMLIYTIKYTGAALLGHYNDII